MIKRVAERIQFELLRRAPVWRKMEMVAQLNATVRLLMLDSLQARYPDASSTELKRCLAELVLGPELAARVYGKRPESSIPRP